MLPATPNPLVQFWFDWWCRGALRSHFNRVHVYADAGGDPYDPAASHLYVANHASFWDGIVLNHWLRRRRRQPAYVMVDADQVAEHPFFRRIGAFSIDRGSPRDGLAAVRYAADLLNASPCAVVVFPQGKIAPAGRRPLAFEHGIARIIERAPRARVVTIGLRYEFWLEQRAEAMVSVSAPWRPPAGASRADVVAHLEQDVTRRLETLAQRGLNWQAGDVLLRGKRSISRWKDDYRLTAPPPPTDEAAVTRPSTPAPPARSAG